MITFIVSSHKHLSDNQKVKGYCAIRTEIPLMQEMGKPKTHNLVLILIPDRWPLSHPDLTKITIFFCSGNRIHSLKMESAMNQHDAIQLHFE